MSVKLYRSQRGIILERAGRHTLLEDATWDDLFVSPPSRNLPEGGAETTIDPVELLAPLDGQEVWCAGVTYYRSRDARVEEAVTSSGGDCYARVYDADRPEIFFKATRARTVGTGQAVCVRSDSHWNVPEPELTLAVSKNGNIFGYTIGNDVSSRDIEGANPLYLPQAKIFKRCCALGPGLLLADEPLDLDTEIAMQIDRDGKRIFDGATNLKRLKRNPVDLVAYLFRDNIFPNGCYLMTGTGIVPPSDFSLQGGDTITITIEPIGTLTNTVEGL